jgi:sugar phosphate isomerase/epimerase
MVKDLGYDGMGKLLWTDELSEVLEAFDSVGLRLSHGYLNVDLTLGQMGEKAGDFGGTAFDPKLKEQLPLLKGRGVQLVLIFYGLKPSDRVRYHFRDSEDIIRARAVAVVREIAELAGTGTEVLLSNMDTYPPEITVEDTLRLANEVNRPNVGIILDLFEYLASTRKHEYGPLLAKAMPRLKAVSVVGTDEFPVPTGSYYLKPLGQGSFDIVAFLKTLKELGYTGPIVLDTQGIGGDRRKVLLQSMEAWRKFRSGSDLKP